MRLRAKILQDTEIKILEESLNTWLEGRPVSEIKNMLFLQSQSQSENILGCHTTMTVIYTDHKEVTPEKSPFHKDEEWS